ncbi:Chaperone protein DnaK [compost metagenome]
MEKANAAKEAVKQALEGDDVDAIKKATDELSEVVQQLSVKMYEQMAAQQQAEGAGEAAGNAGPKADNVVDADYTVVDEDKK